MSTYFYEGLLGLTFAMRATPAAEEVGSDACATAETELGLGVFSLAARFGLGCAEIQAARDVAALSQARGGAGAPLVELRSAAAAALGARSTRPLSCSPRFGFSIDPAAARLLHQAHGWRATPAGNASFEWSYVEGESAGDGRLSADVLVPAGSPAGMAMLELPVELLVSPVNGVAMELHVDWSTNGVERASLVVLEGKIIRFEASAGAPDLAPSVALACGGTGLAAAMVEGRRPLPFCGSRESSVLLLQMPAGLHRVVASVQVPLAVA